MKNDLLTVKVDTTPSRPTPKWIDWLAYRSVHIGQWHPNPDGFWPRLANLAFHSALLARLHGDQDEPLWKSPLNSVETLAVAHLAERLLASGFVVADENGAPDIDILATKAVWTEAYADLPRAFGAPPIEDHNKRGRWFVRLAATLAEEFAAVHPEWAQAVLNRFHKLNAKDRFLTLRLCKWSYPRGPLAGLEDSGSEYIHHLYGHGSEHACLYTQIYQTTPELRDIPRIHWTFSAWLDAGWRKGLELTEESAQIGIPKIWAEFSAHDQRFTVKLLKQLESSSPDGVTAKALGAACVAYIEGRLGLLQDWDDPEACVHALDYGFWMALGVRGLIPEPLKADEPTNPPTTAQ